MERLMVRGLNPMQLANAYRCMLRETNGMAISHDREGLVRILREEYDRLYPDSFMPRDAREETVTSIYNNYGRIEECAVSLGIDSIDGIVEAMRRGATAQAQGCPGGIDNPTGKGE